jgi:hypothetical protein
MYTPQFVYSIGSVIQAAQVQANLAEMTNYINQEVVATDIYDNSVETEHIVRPTFVQVSGDAQGAYFETGCVFANRYPPIGLTIGAAVDNVGFNANGFIAKPLQSSTADITNWKPVNKTGFSFYIEKPSNIYIEYSGEFISPDDHTNPGTTINSAAIAVDGTVEVSSIFYWRQFDATLSTYDNERRIYQTSIMKVAVARGWHHCSIVSGITSNIALVGAMNLTLEVMNTLNA